jgi:Xaa-Pro aminopeptidase
LFRNNTSEHEKIWEGDRLDNDEVKKKYDFSKIHSMSDYEDLISGYINNKEIIYIEQGLNCKLDNVILKKSSKIEKTSQIEIIPLSSITHKLRLIKSNYEIKMIRDAAKVSIEAHKNAMKKSKPGIYEYELDAEIKYIFNKNNMHFAYMSIVGGGNNGCTLHYVKNNCLLKDKDLVLIDAAAENNGYASDITRTFPVNGKFTKEQSQIYDVVLEAQEQTIKFIKPGVTWDQVHQVTVDEISKGLIKLNLLKDSYEDVIKNELYKDFFMHRTGHWLGLDVHDVGEYENILFEPGMVITVEPGIYINALDSKVEKKWRGIGIRIEDDVLITKNGNEVITIDLPKKRNEIEALCN